MKIEKFVHEDGMTEQKVNLFNLVNDENGDPKLEVINSTTMYYINEYEMEDVIDVICRLTNARNLHLENQWAVGFNHDREILGVFHLAQGDMTGVYANDRNLATFIILTGALGFAMFHNHSVDDRTPSDSDKTSVQGHKFFQNRLGLSYYGDYIISRTGWRNINNNVDHVFNETDAENKDKEV